MQTDGLASLLAIGLNGPALRHTLLRALITVIGPSGLRTLSLARTNIRNAAAGAGKQAVRIGNHQRKLEGDCGEEKSMVVNLKFPASRHAIPPQCEIRNASSLSLFPAIKGLEHSFRLISTAFDCFRLRISTPVGRILDVPQRRIKR